MIAPETSCEFAVTHVNGEQPTWTFAVLWSLGASSISTINSILSLSNEGRLGWLSETGVRPLNSLTGSAFQLVFPCNTVNNLHGRMK
jgi:hypothetical protein